jgi:hypothetical protein
LGVKYNTRINKFKLRMVIATKRKFSIPRVLLLLISLIALVILPVVQVAAFSQDNENLIMSSEPNNKIDNKLSWYIKEYDLKNHDEIKIVVDYDRRPSRLDEKKLELLQGEVLYVSHYLDSIIATPRELRLWVMLRLK